VSGGEGINDIEPGRLLRVTGRERQELLAGIDREIASIDERKEDEQGEDDGTPADRASGAGRRARESVGESRAVQGQARH
jgi:hypothetical protein